MAMPGQERLVFMPGAAVPMAGVRAPLAQRLLQGRACALAPVLLGSLYSMCGQAHRVCSQLALAALEVGEGALHRPDAPQRLALWREALREHLRRLFMDWPRLLGQGRTPCMPLLVACPGLQPELQYESLALQAWLEQHVLGMPMSPWLQGCQKNPGAWLLQWVHESPTVPAQLLLGALPMGGALQCTWPVLELDDGGAVLKQLSVHMRADDAFTSRPHLGGRCLETGCWSRAGAVPVHDVWTRLAMRIAEVTFLAQDTQGKRLQAGAWSLGAGESIAWCETARGVLVHWLQVDGQGRIERYSVLAPTEWNFHPQGAVAQLVRALPELVAPHEVASAVDLLVASWDPCVGHTLGSAQTLLGGAHA